MNTDKYGIELLRDRSLDKSTAFTEPEKEALSLVGFVPDGLRQDELIGLAGGNLLR